MATKVIVFGPTGNVGGYVARTAEEHGASVYLAMRDTSKTIPGLSSEQEKQGSFERVTADLTKPDTVAEAVKQSGATRAFIYLAHMARDHMKATLEALRSAGIDTVVFLSSYTITKPLAEVESTELIPYMHAQVELQLENIFGPQHYVAIRPGAFATNAPHWFHKGIEAGEVKLFGENVKFDWTPAEDMGGVAGVILAKGTKDGEKIVYVFGPQYISVKEAFEVVQKEALDKQVKTVSLKNEEEQIQNFLDIGLPPPFAKYLGQRMSEKEAGEGDEDFAHLEEGQKNVQKYLNRPGVTWSEWVRKNKAAFQ